MDIVKLFIPVEAGLYYICFTYNCIQYRFVCFDVVSAEFLNFYLMPNLNARNMYIPTFFKVKVSCLYDITYHDCTTHMKILSSLVATWPLPWSLTGQGLVAEWIRRQPSNRKIAGSIPVYGRFDTPFSEEFNLTMLTIVHAFAWSGL